MATEEDQLDEELNKLNNPKLSVLSKVWNLATTGTARPNAKSEQDGENEEGVARQKYPLAGQESNRYQMFSM